MGEHHETRRPRRARLLVTSVLISALVAGLGQTSAGASAADCTVPAGAFKFHASFSNGNLSLGSAKATGLTSTACGSIQIVGGQFISTVQPADISFPPANVKLLFLSLPSTITVNAPLSGPAVIAPDFSKADMSLTASLTASAKLLGFTCQIGPLTPTLTTGKSGTMTGRTFVNSGDGFSGTVVANNFAVPAIKKSSTCPWLIATLSNVLVGLPAAPGKASISLDGNIKLG